MNNPRKIIFILIGIICVISIIFAIYSQFNFSKPSTPPNNNITETGKINETDIINNFDTIFSNNIDYQKNNIPSINKIDYNKELVYTSYEISEQIQNKYAINAKIPAININQANIIKVNADIENTFKNKISDIIAQSSSSNNQLYDVEYMSYINSNILSLVIKATLKSGESAQRIIIKTYNYNLTSNEEVSLEQLLALRGVSKSYARKKIQETITKANISSQSLKDLGYHVYIRNLNSDIYSVENTATYFIGKNSVLYIIYPYGNSNMTSEMDIIVF